MDIDSEHEYADGIGIRNVPAVAYYRGIQLVGIVIGKQQDISGNVNRPMRGEPPASSR